MLRAVARSIHGHVAAATACAGDAEAHERHLGMCWAWDVHGMDRQFERLWVVLNLLAVLVHEGEARGAGEILLTSMDRDGTNLGFDTPLLEAACAAVGLPVVASGGFGAPAHAPEAISAGADAVLLAGALHRGETTISRIKRTLADAGEEVRACLSPA